MHYDFKLSNAERKAFVKVVAEITGAAAEFQFAPTFAYKIGAITVDRGGVMFADDGSDCSSLLRALEVRGFVPSGTEPEQNSAITVADMLTDTQFARLRRLADNKAELIKTALQVDSLPIERNGGGVRFAWLRNGITPSETDCVVNFASALIDTAKSRSRVLPKASASCSNPKFAMRVFLAWAER